MVPTRPSGAQRQQRLAFACAPACGRARLLGGRRRPAGTARRRPAPGWPARSSASAAGPAGRRSGASTWSAYAGSRRVWPSGAATTTVTLAWSSASPVSAKSSLLQVLRLQRGDAGDRERVDHRLGDRAGEDADADQRDEPGGDERRASGGRRSCRGGRAGWPWATPVRGRGAATPHRPVGVAGRDGSGEQVSGGSERLGEQGGEVGLDVVVEVALHREVEAHEHQRERPRRRGARSKWSPSRFSMWTMQDSTHSRSRSVGERDQPRVLEHHLTAAGDVLAGLGARRAGSRARSRRGRRRGCRSGRRR